MSTITPLFRRAFGPIMMLAILAAIPKARAVDALLLKDTYVDSTSNKAGINYGASGDLRVFKSSTANMRAFMKFSLATLPAGTGATDIKQARLRLWVSNSSTTLGSITLTPVTSGWSESTLTHNTSTSLSTFFIKHENLPISSTGNFVSIDVTNWVQAWVYGTMVNEGFLIEAGSASASLNLFFDSKESSLTSHEPQLDITLQGQSGPSLGIFFMGKHIPWVSYPAQEPFRGWYYLQDTDVTIYFNLFDAASVFGLPRGTLGASVNIHPADGTAIIGTIPDLAAQLRTFAPVDFSAGFVDPAGNPPFPLWAYYGPTGNPLNVADIPATYRTPLFAGPVSAAGPQGPKGDTGAQGAQGSIGPAGATGPAGTTGPAGPQGPQGLIGAVGPTGATGPAGPAGAQGPQGQPGAQGPQGVAGVNGTKWYSWTGAPAQATGVFGDFYLDLSTGDVWKKEMDEGGPVWVLEANIRGVAGGDGAAGPAGPAGVAGPAGPIGPQGPLGPKGDTGDSGVAGQTGPMGPAGPQGQTGAQGPQGIPGELSGIDYVWSTATTEPPAAGSFRLNAPTGEGFIYLSFSDTHGRGQFPFINSMLASTNPTKGYFVATRADNPSFAKVFEVTAGANAGGYYQLSVARIFESGGSWADNSPVKVAFIRNGDKGDAGVAGPKGDTGDAGPMGPQGPAGPAGLTGPLGPTGPQGPAGPAGDLGPTGPSGSAGPAGPAGPQGPAGPALTRVEPQGDLSMGEFTEEPTP